MRKILVVAVIFIFLPSLASAQNYYVATDGDDNNPGTLEEPFRTIEKARDIVRTVNDDMHEDIIVYLRGGTYELESAFELDERDSGTNGFYVIYTNYAREVPVISGGMKVTGWLKEEGNEDIWEAYVGTHLDTRQLYVNGVRTIRARSDFGLPNVNKTDTGFIDDFGEVMENWGNLDNVELVNNYAWKQFRCGIEKISKKHITVKELCWNYSQWHKKPTTNGIIFKEEVMSNVTWIENAYELLDSPGEWYLNKATGWLYYIPKEGEDMTTAEVILPLLETIIQGRGTTDNPVSNIKFQGLTFSYATWLGPNGEEGFSPYFSTAYSNHIRNGKRVFKEVPGNLQFVMAKSIVFANNIFSHLGAVGLDFRNETSDIVISGNHFFDISSSAIFMGEPCIYNESVQGNAYLYVPYDNPFVSKNHSISNNYIHDVAVEYECSAGITLRYVEGTSVAHNYIDGLPYTGMIVDGGFAFDSIPAKNNKMHHNFISNNMQVMHDGGGIYASGPQPGSEIYYNVLNGHTLPFPEKKSGGGVYLDLDSRYFSVHHNVIVDNEIRNVNIKGGNHNVSNNWWEDRGIFSKGQAINMVDIRFLDINYSPRDRYKKKGYGPNIIEGNTKITTLSEAPSYIIDNAGLEIPYKNIMFYIPDDKLYGDFDGDGREDELNVYHDTRSWDVSLGNTYTVENWIYGWGSANRVNNGKNLPADLDGDEKDDIFLVYNNPEKKGWTWHVGISNGEEFVRHKDALIGQDMGKNIEICDYDGDGSEEIIVYSDVNHCLKFNDETKKLDSEECSRTCKSADLNDDGIVDILDMGIVATNFGKKSGFDPVADTDSSGEIDIFDIVFVASRFN